MPYYVAKGSILPWSQEMTDYHNQLRYTPNNSPTSTQDTIQRDTLRPFQSRKDQKATPSLRWTLETTFYRNLSDARNIQLEPVISWSQDVPAVDVADAVGYGSIHQVTSTFRECANNSSEDNASPLRRLPTPLNPPTAAKLMQTDSPEFYIEDNYILKGYMTVSKPMNDLASSTASSSPREHDQSNNSPGEKPCRKPRAIRATSEESIPKETSAILGFKARATSRRSGLSNHNASGAALLTSITNTENVHGRSGVKWATRSKKGTQGTRKRKAIVSISPEHLTMRRATAGKKRKERARKSTEI
jgi:hypothetical protein